MTNDCCQSKDVMFKMWMTLWIVLCCFSILVTTLLIGILSEIERHNKLQKEQIYYQKIIEE